MQLFEEPTLRAVWLPHFCHSVATFVRTRNYRLREISAVFVTGNGLNVHLFALNSVLLRLARIITHGLLIDN